MRKTTVLKWMVVLSFLAGIIFGGMNFSSATKDSGDVEWNGSQLSTLEVNGKPYVPADELAKASGSELHKKRNHYTVSSRLDRIMKKGVIRVGTTGDYKPFTFYNTDTKKFEGYDIEAAELMAKDLGVKVKFVKTSWPTLMNDLLDDKFDMAVGGISRNTERQKTAQLTRPYMNEGKAPLIRAVDKEKYTSLQAIDQPNVTIGVNPGGTNQKFVDANIKHAKVIVVENNLEIPHMVAEGKVDVMITDSTEAMYYASRDQRLYAALTDNTFTKSQKGYLIPRGDSVFENWVNLWMDEMELQGEFNRLKDKYIYNK
ncbi:transporter substrate-binding domain-containing protein [Fictibacillus sp. KIGAM418]|uniref:Transporter substrate-binding domain-containing protein n=1 Tax=Fictibacillus marinisediminis TaxID=2878389 RepID=A0A9X1X9C8_9BACL|nr:transporter substrate-binding domain-containing protein [Fictibacillus marinisediminis]MCK6255560.1 transporter substrate-binding domain-containing protein [Fictibacillus marinisediminis]